MDVQELAPGETVPNDRDRVVLARLPSGKFEFSGVVRTGGTHAHFADHRAFDTIDEAKAAGIIWAKEKGATELLIAMPNA